MNPTLRRVGSVILVVIESIYVYNFFRQSSARPGSSSNTLGTLIHNYIALPGQLSYGLQALLQHTQTTTAATQPLTNIVAIIVNFLLDCVAILVAVTFGIPIIILLLGLISGTILIFQNLWTTMTEAHRLEQ